MRNVNLTYNKKTGTYTLYQNDRIVIMCSYHNKRILSQICEKLGYENRRYNIPMGQRLEDR